MNKEEEEYETYTVGLLPAPPPQLELTPVPPPPDAPPQSGEGAKRAAGAAWVLSNMLVATINTPARKDLKNICILTVGFLQREGQKE